MLHEENGRESLKRLLNGIMDQEHAETLLDVLLENYGTLYSLADSLNMHKGDPPIPETVRTLLTMTPQLCRMREMSRMDLTAPLDTLEEAARYVSALYIGAQYEQLYILCLDEEYRLIDSCLVSEGGLNEVPVYLRRVMQKVLHCGAKAIILCHNHPSGWTSFSETDVVATRAILSVCTKMQISMIDHLLAARDRVISMRSRLYIPDDMWRASGPMAPPVAVWRRQPEDQP